MMRPTPRRLVKLFFVVTVGTLLLMNMNLLLRTGRKHRPWQNKQINSIDVPQETDVGKLPIQTVHRNTTRWNGTRHGWNHTRILHKPNHDEGSIYSRTRTKMPRAESNLTAIRLAIADANQHQEVLNGERFPVELTEHSVVVVVQVHNRLGYLRHLIASFRNAAEIQKTLLIFSHDYYSDDINALIGTIDFCPVMQIFYPWSIQLHEKVFPGEDPKDCPRNIKKAEAVARGCINANHPDKYGHYREAKYTQTKHHWWWKLNQVFDNLRLTQQHTGPVLLVEEDHYLSPDFVPVLRGMFDLRKQSCKDCSILTLGMYVGSSYKGTSGQVDIMDWHSTKHNMGMALDRTAWTKIKACAQQFCQFDDYNWDWSLQFIGVKCLPGRLRVMVMKSPRIFHIGECGVHHRGKNCNPVVKVKQIEQQLAQNRQHLFPSAVTISSYPHIPARLPKPNGGWGDTRDHALCLKFVNR